MHLDEESFLVLYVGINSLHVKMFQATGCILDRKRINRTHLLTVQKVDEIGAKLETPAKKNVGSTRTGNGLVAIFSTNCNRTAAF
jgi:hypothetical protein